MKYNNILWIYNDFVFKSLANSYFISMIDELKKDFSVCDYNDFSFNYERYKYIIFITRSIQIVENIDNKCLDIFFEKFLHNSPNNKIILYIEDYLCTKNFDFLKIKYLVNKYSNKIKIAFSIYPTKYLNEIEYLNVPFFIPDYKIDLKLDKKFDFLLWGKRNLDHYPFRNKISIHIQKKSKHIINVKNLEHPGYNISDKKHDIFGKKLHLLLSNFWFSLCTCENRNYKSSFMPRKYLECMLNGTIPVGDYPKMLNIHTKYNFGMINIENFDFLKSDLEMFLSIFLLKKEKLKEIIINNYNLAKEFTFEKQNEYFYRIILGL